MSWHIGGLLLLRSVSSTGRRRDDLMHVVMGRDRCGRDRRRRWRGYLM